MARCDFCRFHFLRDRLPGYYALNGRLGSGFTVSKPGSFHRIGDARRTHAGIPAILLATRMLDMPKGTLDAYAFVLPAGMFLQRIGCFLSGCCYGTVTTSGWGIQYGHNTAAFRSLHYQNIIPADAIRTISLHPVQLYESLGCLIAVVVIWKIKSKFASSGSLFFLSGLLYFSVRLIAEFFRADQAHALRVSSWAYLNSVQWLMIVLIVIACLVIFLSERREPKIIKPAQASPRPSLSVFCFILVSVVFIFASKWLSIIEIAVVYLVILSIAAEILVMLFHSVTAPEFRTASISLILLCFLIMSQTYPEQAASDSTKITYNTISIGGLLGAEYPTLAAVVTSDCDGNSTVVPETKYKHTFKLAGLGLSRTIQTGISKSVTIGLNGYMGIHNESVTGAYFNERIIHSYGINPFVQADFKRFAIGTGVHIGDMSVIGSPDRATSITRYRVYPQFYMRFGNLNTVFGELSYANNFPGSFPGNQFQGDVGFGFSHKRPNSGTFRIGTSSSTAIFLTSNIPIGENFVLSPYVGFLGSRLFKYRAGYDEMDASIGALSVHYKFNKKLRAQ